MCVYVVYKWKLPSDCSGLKQYDPKTFFKNQRMMKRYVAKYREHVKENWPSTTEAQWTGDYVEYGDGMYSKSLEYSQQEHQQHQEAFQVRMAGTMATPWDIDVTGVTGKGVPGQASMSEGIRT